MVDGYAVVSADNAVVVDGPIHSNADARLIAAAPDLLETAKALIARSANGDIGEELDALRAAIARAEGCQP